ncbi:MAG: hypothetical protein FWC40_06090, partial [Proteobacteria bacterium]|nr:hypothetical protein [Pseudomonadota bacterium]
PAASKALREDMHTGYARLIDIQTAEARVGTGIFLESIRNDALAVKAFTGSQDARSYGKGAKLAHIRACLRSGCQDKVTLKIIDTFHQQTDIDDLLSLLEREQRLDLAQVPLTRMLSKGDLKARIAAYQSLVRLAAERNDETQIARYRQQLEQSDPRNADIQKILAQTCIQRGLWDDAVRHLTYLTILRPDSREVLDLSFSLSKRAPEHEGAQRLWQSQLQAARGKFHRLEWIAQAYERYGQTQEALTWYEEARRFGTIPNHILLRLAIALSDEHRQREYRNQLSRSDYAQLFDLVSLYQSMGNWTEARHLIQHYMHAYPSDQSAQMNVRLKQENLKIAMDSGDMDLIRMRLAEAIAHPVAEVMIPLLERGAMLNAMDAIELFEAEGQFEMALDSLIRIEDAHMQVNSLPVTQQTMQRYVSFSPRHSSQVAARMANQALLGPSPCEALLYLPSTTQPELWASALLACPQATSSIKEALSALRANMTKRRRSAFDQQLYEILAASNSDFIPQAQSLITHTDLDVRAIQRIETSLRQENPLQALQCFYTCAMPDQDIPKALASFAQYGYDKESIEAASSVWPMLSDTWRLEVAWHMANFGVKSDNISDALRKASPDRWTMPISKEVILAIPEDVIVYWIDHAPPHAFGNVISMALQHVSTNPNHSDLIGHLTKNIHSRPQKLTFLLQFADHALRYGYEFNREAQEALRDALKIQPDSELIWLKLSVAQGQHCVLLPSESPCGTLSTTEQCSQIDDAIISLEKGSHMAMQISEYWHEAARLHHLSPIELRRHIHSQRHAHSPNTVNMMLDDLALNLEENHADKAVAIARVLSEGAAPFLWMQIAGKFTQAKAEIPDFLTKADHAYAQQLAARRALDTGDLHQAATHYQQAASLSLWPLEIYEEAMQAFASRQAWNVLEQFIDQTLQAYPHAYLPYLWRAILRVERGDIEQAMNDYRKARSRSFDSNTILVPMFVTLAKHEYVDLALEVLEQTPKALRRHDLILRALADNTRNDARAAAKRLDFANRVLALSDTDILASEPLLSAYLYLTGVANDTARSRQLRRLHAIRMP